MSCIHCDPTLRRVVELRKERRSMPEIARIMGWSSGASVVARLQQHGDPELLKPLKRRPKPHPAWWAEAVRMRAAGVPKEQVARAIGRPSSTVHEAITISQRGL